jgi:hypothetical protein
MFNNDDFNDHITKNMLRDENGKDKVLCTDINRKNFTYKDEKSGKLISDAIAKTRQIKFLVQHLQRS